MARLLSRCLLVLLVGSGLALLVFVRPRHVVATPEGRTRVTYWEHWTGPEAEAMRQIVDTFNDTVGRERNIWVDFTSMSQIDRKLLVATAGGVPPDIAGLWDVQLCEFAAMGALEPLDELADAKGLTRDKYKPVFYDGCRYDGRLYALPSTPWNTALYWNKEIFQRRASDLRAAGLDPDRAPTTLDELDRYAAVLDEWERVGGRKRIKSAGYIPMEPGWWIHLTTYWFGGTLVDATGTRLTFDSPTMRTAFEWVEGYAKRLGPDAMTDFRSGFGGFSSPQNPFLSGTVAMVMQGPWMANFIEKLKPGLNRWQVSPRDLSVEAAFANVARGQSRSDVIAALGTPDATAANAATWTTATRVFTITFADDRVTETSVTLTSADKRQQYCQWGVAPFPSAVPGLTDVNYGGMDALVIPRGAKHRAEAFEFIAFVNRQDQMERLCSQHGKGSPLVSVSDAFVQRHPNPYIATFNRLADSPNARPLPQIANWPETADELTRVAEQVNLRTTTPADALAVAQRRAQAKLDEFLATQRRRDGGGARDR